MRTIFGMIMLAALVPACDRGTAVPLPPDMSGDMSIVYCDVFLGPVPPPDMPTDPTVECAPGELCGKQGHDKWHCCSPPDPNNCQTQ